MLGAVSSAGAAQEFEPLVQVPVQSPGRGLTPYGFTDDYALVTLVFHGGVVHGEETAGDAIQLAAAR